MNVEPAAERCVNLRPGAILVAVALAVYGGLALALASRNRRLRRLAVVAAAAYASTPLRRAFRRMPGARERTIAAVAVPALMAVTDAAKMTGYVRGLLRRARGRDEPR